MFKTEIQKLTVHQINNILKQEQFWKNNGTTPIKENSVFNAESGMNQTTQAPESVMLMTTLNSLYFYWIEIDFTGLFKVLSAKFVIRVVGRITDRSARISKPNDPL